MGSMFEPDQVPSWGDHTTVSLAVGEVIDPLAVDINVKMRFVSEIGSALDDEGRIRWRGRRIPRCRARSGPC